MGTAKGTQSPFFVGGAVSGSIIEFSGNPDLWCLHMLNLNWLKVAKRVA